MKKLIGCLISFVLFLFCASCNTTKKIETVLDSLENAETGIAYEGTYSQFKNINIEASYLGYGYDIINDEYIKKDYINLSAPIIDLKKLDNIKLKLIKENNAETMEVEADTMEEFSENYSTSLKIYGKMGNVFSGGISMDFKGSTNTKTYTHYYKKILEVKTFNLYMTNSLQEIKDLLSDEFKNDLLSLHPEALFEKYGTHMLKEVSMGGRIEVTSQYSSVKSGASAEVKSAVNSHISQLKFGNIDSKLLIEAEQKLQNENIDYYYNVKQVGGSLTNINSISSLNEKCDDWLKSFDENLDYSALSGIVGENSLIALWDLLPDDEITRREQLYNAFKNLSGDSFNKLCENFKINTKRTLNVTSEGPGQVGTYDYQNEDGDEVILQAIPTENSRFVGWYSGDELVSNSTTYKFNIHVNTSLVAKFRDLNDDSCLLVVHISGKGEVGGDTNQIHKIGDSIMLEAKAYAKNEFKGWYINNELVSEKDVYTFKITTDTTIVAIFTNNEVDKYKLVVNKLGNGNGTITYDAEYYPKSVATIIANPDENSYFVGWENNEGKLLSDNLEYSFIINEDTILFARFDQIQSEEFTITITIFPEEKGRVNGIKTSYALKELVTLEAVPVDGYQFTKFKIDGSDVLSNPYSFNIDKNMNIIVFFEEKVITTYYLTYNLNNENLNVDANLNQNNIEVSSIIVPQFTVPTSTYLIFKGWYTKDDIQISNESGKVIHNVKNFTDSYGRWIGESINLYAKWEYNKEYNFIKTVDDFNNIRNKSNEKFVLLNNLNFNNYKMSPINKFSGMLDGNGKTISNWSCVQNAIANFAIFLENTGEIKNLKLDSCKMTNNDPDGHGTVVAGILCALNKGNIYDIIAQYCSMAIDVGSINNNNDNYCYVGIICGINYKSISNITVKNCEMPLIYAGTKYKGSRAQVGFCTGRCENGSLYNINSENNVANVTVKADEKVYLSVCVQHGRPHGFLGGVVGYATNSTISGYIKNSNNTLNLTIKRDCSCDDHIDKYCGGYCGKIENCVVNINN